MTTSATYDAQKVLHLFQGVLIDFCLAFFSISFCTHGSLYATTLRRHVGKYYPNDFVTPIALFRAHFQQSKLSLYLSTIETCMMSFWLEKFSNIFKNWNTNERDFTRGESISSDDEKTAPLFLFSTHLDIFQFVIRLCPSTAYLKFTFITFHGISFFLWCKISVHIRLEKVKL